MNRHRVHMPADLPPGAQDTARVVVIHHPACRHGSRIADAVARHFEGQSELIGIRPITTRILSEAADPTQVTGPPPVIDADASRFTVAILLADTALTEALAGPWSRLRDTLVRAIPSADERPEYGFCLPLVVSLDKGALDPLRSEEALAHSLGSIQAERAYDWPRGVSDGHAVTRILLQACRLILDGLDRIARNLAADYSEPTRRLVFLSHAKADLRAAEAEESDALVRRLTERMRATNYGLEAYLDDTHALPGWPWRDQFRKAIARGAFLVVDTDAYAARPICQWELLQAKRVRRPILSIDAVRVRQPLSFAYGGNLPNTRVLELDDAGVDRLLLDLMTEMVRIELWLHEARAAAQRAELPEPVLLPRPVELTDLAFHVLDRGPDGPRATLIYPDPPLSRDLRELIDALRPSQLRVLPLSELQMAQ